MKRFLSAGEGYGRSRGSGSPAQPQMDKVFRLSLCTPKVTGMLLLAAFFCFFSTDRAMAVPVASTTSPIDSIRPLQIGDTIPEALWDIPLRVTNHPAGMERMTLRTLKESRLLIVNFWSPSCKPCLESIFAINGIIRELDTDGIVQIPMTANSREDLLLKYFERERRDFFTVVNANDLNHLLLGNYTGHFGIAWIKDGRLFAVPRKRSITAATVGAVLEGAIDPDSIENYQSMGERRRSQ